MTSEIRVNKITHTTGVGTITTSVDGIVVSGIITANNFSGSVPASNLTGTVADARISTLTASKLSGALPAISAANLTNLPAANITGTLPAIDGSALTGINTAFGNSSVNTTGIMTATSFVPTTGQLSHRNLIINGAMNIAQRGTSSTSQGYQTVDRYKFGYNGHDEALTQSQGDVASGTTPYTLGFRKTFKVTNGNQTSGAGASDYVYIDYSFEAQDIANSGWNYNSASSFVTFSFWIKSSVAQSFKGYFITGDGTDYSYAFDTGSLTADTWTKVTKTIPGNSNLTVDNDTGRGLGFSLWPFIGTDLTNNSTSEDAWVTHSGSGRTKDATSTWWTTNDATFELTGLQLEVGPVATPFEHKSFIEDKLRCYRYFYQPERGSYLLDLHGQGHRVADTLGAVVQAYPWPVEMRATPSVSYDDNNGNSNRFAVNGSNNSTTFNVALSLQQNVQGIMGAFQYPHGISGISENESFRLWAYNFKASAEL